MRDTKRLVSTGTDKAVWVIGDLFTFLVTGEQSNGNVFTLEVIVQPNNGPGPHVHHGADEQFYVVEGNLTYWVGDQTFAVSAGDFIYIPRGTAHAFRNGPKPAKLLATFTPAGIEAFFEHIGTPVTDRSAPPAVTQEMIEHLMAASKGWEHQNESLPPESLPGFRR